VPVLLLTSGFYFTRRSHHEEASTGFYSGPEVHLALENSSKKAFYWPKLEWLQTNSSFLSWNTSVLSNDSKRWDQGRNISYGGIASSSFGSTKW